MKILVCETNQLAVWVVGGVVVKLFLILSTHFAVWTAAAAAAVKQVLVLRRSTSASPSPWSVN